MIRCSKKDKVRPGNEVRIRYHEGLETTILHLSTLKTGLSTFSSIPSYVFLSCPVISYTVYLPVAAFVVCVSRKPLQTLIFSCSFHPMSCASVQMPTRACPYSLLECTYLLSEAQLRPFDLFLAWNTFRSFLLAEDCLLFFDIRRCIELIIL
jgi:hypothetical protein